MIRNAPAGAAVCALILLAPSAWSAESHYNLGGDCVDSNDVNGQVQAMRAEESGAWNLAIEWEKVSVREMCGNEYRWEILVNALLHGERKAEAVEVLQEMDARGFDLNPTFMKDHPGIPEFMNTAIFKSSPIGQKIDALKKVSDERRARYRELLARIPPGEKPADPYIAKGACPGEGCRYGDWLVVKDTDLVDAPESARTVGRAKRGDHVVGVTGEVHLTPVPVVVLASRELPEKSIAWLLDYTGEGYGTVYSQGKFFEEYYFIGEYCFRVSVDSCWGETLTPDSERKGAVWWQEVKLSNGVTGWAPKATSNNNGASKAAHDAIFPKIYLLFGQLSRQVLTTSCSAVRSG